MSRTRRPPTRRGHPPESHVVGGNRQETSTRRPGSSPRRGLCDSSSSDHYANRSSRGNTNPHGREWTCSSETSRAELGDKDQIVFHATGARSPTTTIHSGSRPMLKRGADAPNVSGSSGPYSKAKQIRSRPTAHRLYAQGPFDPSSGSNLAGQREEGGLRAQRASTLPVQVETSAQDIAQAPQPASAPRQGSALPDRSPAVGSC